MIAELKPYPSMKDSGAPWLGGVPKHWEVRRLRDSIEGCINGIWGSESNGREDLLCVRVADFDRQRLRVKLLKPTMRAIAPNERKRRMLEKGDLLLEKSGGGDLQPVGVVVLYDHEVAAVCSNFVARMPVAAGCNSSYLTYFHAYLYSIRLNVRSIKQTTGIQNLDSSAYLSEPVALPPVPEQAAIVRFLDHADRRIRRYIRAKQKLIKLLEEQKQAIIHRAVTRGLDPNVRLKPSGVNWLEEVPEHWEVRRLKQLFRELDNRSDSGTELLLSLRMYKGLVPHNDVSQTRIASNALVGFKRVQPGQLVMNRMRAAIGMFGVASQPGLVSPDYAVFASRPSVEVSYFLHLFKTRVLGTTFRAESKGLGTGSSGFMRLYTDRFGIIKVPVPPRAEQEAIVRGIAELTAEITITTDRVEKEISLLREYRTRLIADVVTGKLDVRAAAANLPDESGEPEVPDDTDALAEGDEPADGDLDAAPEEAEA